MGRLVPGAIGLLFLASVVWSAAVNADGEKEEREKRMKEMKQDIKAEYASKDNSNSAYRKNIVQFDRLMNLPNFKDGNKNATQIKAEKILYMEALLVAKTCFRDWVDDVECHVHVYEREKNAANGDKTLEAKAKVDYKIGYESEQRVYNQTLLLKEMAKSNTHHFDKVLRDLQKNFNDMVNSYEKELDEIATVFSKHLESEGVDMIKELESEMKSLNIGHDEMRHAVVKLAIADWVSAEKTKSERAGFGMANKHKWVQMMNKIPGTLKYNTRGATPFKKEHLARALDILGKRKWYEEAKSKSQAYLQEVATHMRHEAMKKSESIISDNMAKMHAKMNV